MRNLWEIFVAFLRLGCTSFGGPIAHLGYFHSEFVEKRKWIQAHAYADLVALCQFLPGPASSQVGIALGLLRGGYGGAFLAWLGFTLPSAAILTLAGIGLIQFGSVVPAGMLHGFKLAALAVVAQALRAMGSKLCPDKERITIAILAAVPALLFPSILGQLAGIFLGAVAGFLVRIPNNTEPPLDSFKAGNHTIAVISILLFLLLLLGLPFVSRIPGGQDLRLIDVFYRAGSMVFGGGHVVLPLLQSEVVNAGWISADAFLAGYGIAQAIPGPLFTFAGYVGAVSSVQPNGTVGAVLCLLATFLPSFLLVFGVIPFWASLRKISHLRKGVIGINAAVVGLLLAAFYNPLWTTAIQGSGDFLIAVSAFCLLQFWRSPPWLIVGLCAVSGWFLV